MAPSTNWKVPGLPIVFVGAPKVANSAIKRSLIAAAGIDGSVGHAHKDLPFERVSLRYVAKNGGGVCAAAEGERLFAFSVVRNPLDRLVSCYEDKVNNGTRLHNPFYRYGMWLGMSFDEFVEKVLSVDVQQAEVHLREMYSLTTWRGSVVPRMVLRYEELDSDFQLVQNAVKAISGKVIPDLGTSNKSKRQDFSLYYDESMRCAISRYYWRDFLEFGY